MVVLVQLFSGEASCMLLQGAVKNAETAAVFEIPPSQLSVT
jgi:hypothetical protein